MKSLYQTTLEQFTGNQELKEGDYVVCPMSPNERLIVKEVRDSVYPLECRTDSSTYSLTKNGKHWGNDQFPLFLKCSPSKKKVEKVFEVYIKKDFIEIKNGVWGFSIEPVIIDGIKAKLIVEVEE
jgi:hypothetical protein